MSPATHLLAGWGIAALFGQSRRERIAIAAVVVLPDLDGLGIIVDALNHRCRGLETNWFHEYHHMVLHGALGAVSAGILAYALGSTKWSSLILVQLSFHLHLLLDIVGSRGPAEGDIWSIYYLSPFSTAHSISWRRQWPLNAWPNLLLTAGLLAQTVYLAVTRGISPVSIFSEHADAAVIRTLRKRFHFLSCT